MVITDRNDLDTQINKNFANTGIVSEDCQAEMLLDELPRAYTPERYQQKCDAVYQHDYDSYQGEGLSIYA